MPIDILLDPTHDLSDATRQAILSEQLQEADCIMAALDCSTKSRCCSISDIWIIQRILVG